MMIRTSESRQDNEQVGGCAASRFALALFGLTVIGAGLPGCDGSTVTTVTAEVHTVDVNPPSVSLHEQQSMPFRAIPRDASGNDLAGRHVTWSSSSPSIAEVNSDGIVRGMARGTASITATVDGRSGQALVTVTPPALGIGFGDAQFALIPEGSFQMGSASGRSDEGPVHTVSFTRSFYMQRTEVTQGQWREIMGSNPSAFTSCGDTCPVERVSWSDIQTFLQALNREYPGRNYRLPTEAEWEYAARAGTTGDYGGNGNMADMGWFSGNSGGRTHPVARKAPNGWGLHDMHGNVWEWVQDWYSDGYGSISPRVDPTGPALGSTRVLRGGSWAGTASDARSAFRNSNTPSFRNFAYGFRLARSL